MSRLESPFRQSVLTSGSLPPLNVPNISNSVKIGSIWCQFNGHSLDMNQWKRTTRGREFHFFMLNLFLLIFEIIFSFPFSLTHPSLDGHSRKILTRELVYYILLGTLRSAQKCLWSNLRVEFSRDIHPWRGHFSRGLYRPQIELQMVAMDLWRNSDVF